MGADHFTLKRHSAEPSVDEIEEKAARGQLTPAQIELYDRREIKRLTGNGQNATNYHEACIEARYIRS